MSYESFSSLPPEEERQFVVFEEFTQQNIKRANIIGWVSAIGMAVVVIGIVAAFWGSKPEIDMNAGAAEEEAAAAAVPAPAPAPAPAAEGIDPGAAAAGAAADTPVEPAAPAPAEGAPATPPGASKAPPTR